MGGEKFDSTHPEGYLFGENTDLNFLGTRPVAVGGDTLGPRVTWLLPPGGFIQSKSDNDDKLWSVI